MANSRNTIPVDTLTSWVRGEIEKYIADATHFRKDTPGAQEFLYKLTEYAGSTPDYDDVGFFFQDAVGDSCVGAWVKYDATMEQLQDSLKSSPRLKAGGGFNILQHPDPWGGVGRLTVLFTVFGSRSCFCFGVGYDVGYG